MKRLITPERLLEENEALRQIIREALPLAQAIRRGAMSLTSLGMDGADALLERMRAAIGEEKGNE